MTKDEKIVIILGGVGLASILLYHFVQRQPEKTPDEIARDEVSTVGGSLSPYTAVTSGPKYLMANAPYAFAPPIGNFLSGQTGAETTRVDGNPALSIDMD